MFGSIVPNLTIYAIVIFIATAGIGGSLYFWHYKPIKKLEATIKSRDVSISLQKTQISNLYTKVENGKQLLEKCKVQAEVSVFETSVSTEANNLDELYQSYLDYKENIDEDVPEKNATIKTKPSIRFIF